MIRIAVCDDEQPCLDELCALLQKHFPAEHPYALQTYRSAEELLCAAAEAPPDIVFMDVELPDLSGVETVARLKESADPIVFFVTAHNTYIQDIFRLHSFQFLPKPVDEEDFRLDLARAVRQYVRDHTRLEVRAGGAVHRLSVGDVRCIEVNRKEVRLHTAGGVLSHYGSIAAYEQKLADHPFAKPHKSYLVNLRHVSAIGADFVLLDGMAERVPLSRKFRAGFLRAFNRYGAGERL